MTLAYPIVSTQTDAKSPIDQDLMDAIRGDLDDLDSRISLNTAQDYAFKVEGYLHLLQNDSYTFKRKKRVAGGLVSQNTTYSECKLFLEDGGEGGDCEVDILRYTSPNALITGIDSLFTGAIQSIARAGAALNTQSITRTTSQILTQSITQYKTTKNIQSIVPLGKDLWQYNLDNAADADYLSGSVIVAGASSGGNNGTFTPLEFNRNGGNNIVVRNTAGVAQSTAVGTLDVGLWQYNFVASVSSEFTVGEYALFAGHTSAVNDGTLVIVAVNSGGNNIVVSHATGTAQGGVAGTCDVQRFKYNLTAAASATDYVVGESILAASHTSAVNDGNLTLVAVNSGGNNLVVYNSVGTTQGGIAGTVNTNRWVYALAVDPSANVTAGDYVNAISTTSSANSTYAAMSSTGLPFPVKEVNRSASNNLVVYNTSGVAQGGAAGTINTSKRKIKFAANQTNITTDSRIYVVGAYSVPEDDYQVSEVNRGGGSNYNAVVEVHSVLEQPGAAGRVALEGKSIFDTKPKVSPALLSTTFSDTHNLTSSNAVLNATKKIVPAGTILALDILSIPAGKPKNISVQLR
jgi:hypothetical protein